MPPTRTRVATTVAAIMAIEIAALVAAGVVLVLWARRRARGGLAVACAVAASFLPLAGLWALSAPSDSCSKVDLAAPQADCESY